ncbi:MAG: DUF1566 domain-containing protein [Bacteroidetes bacterium]|nr:DUF1566 domain-containing protein [Bacteroidota bacterium]
MKNLSFLIVFMLLFSSTLLAQVGINTDNLPPDPSAGLDVNFSDKGLLPPRVELTAPYVAAPVVAPATGLLVYNTATSGNPPDNVVPGYYYWDGNMWRSFVASAGTNGQTLRYDGGNWIANSVLYNDGTNIGIGLINPTHKLTVAGPAETVRLIGPGAWGSLAKLNFGDEDYVSISENIDDHLLIHANAGLAIMGGKVGIGTTSPGEMLTVDGMIHTTSGGVMFPDGTTQTTAAGANVHAIGESYGGGIVFYVSTGGQHGLIAAVADQSTGIQWYNGSNTTTNAVRDDVFAGQSNTERIIISQGAGSYAAQLCANFKGGYFGDWYLPSKYELNLLYQQKDMVGGFASGLSALYWSSSEMDVNNAWLQNFGNSGQYTNLKSSIYYIRAIRAF